jgi:hypothetical protein
MLSRTTADTWLRFAVLTAIAVALSAEQSRAQNPPGLGPTDHQKVYRIGEGPPFTGLLELRDQFGFGNYQYQGPFWLSTPVQKNTEPIRDPATHYLWYEIFKPLIDPVRQVVVQNQFGEGLLEVRNAHYLLVPALKNQNPGTPLPTHQNHFKCYDAIGGSALPTVTLVNQFGTEVVQVLRPALLCNPVEKTHAGQVFPILFPQDHFVCYDIFPRAPLGVGVTVTDQIAPTQRPAFILENQWLCVPSLKTGVTAAVPSTWSRVKAQYRD